MNAPMSAPEADTDPAGHSPTVSNGVAGSPAAGYVVVINPARWSGSGCSKLAVAMPAGPKIRSSAYCAKGSPLTRSTM